MIHVTKNENIRKMIAAPHHGAAFQTTDPEKGMRRFLLILNSYGVIQRKLVLS
jgi:hypothetical protein